MATLTLEPDEVLPNTPAPIEGEALGPYSIFWRGKERQMLLRSVELRRSKHFIFAHEVGDEMAGNWLLYERQTLMPARWSPGSPARKLHTVASEFAMRDWNFGRFLTFHILPNKTARVLLGEESIGAWLDAEFRVQTTFDFPSTILKSDRLETQRYWQREFDDPDSTIGFAARWSSWVFFTAADAPADHTEMLFGEHLDELFQVMGWVLKCEPRLWKQGSNWDWKLGPQTPDFSYLFCPQTRNFENFEFNLPFIYAVGRFLVEEHLPPLVKPLSEKHRCVREFLASELVWIRCFVENPPTAHERLEAALNLRAWLRKNRAPAELLALLNSNQRDASTSRFLHHFH